MRQLGDGRQIPAFGLGTLNLGENEARDIIREAVLFGYRMFDTSPVYGNEKAVGHALLNCLQHGLVKREELFIVSKLWITDRNNVQEALRETLKNLHTDYVDLLLIHYMIPDMLKDTNMVERVSI